jgi:hypothetical protein
MCIFHKGSWALGGISGPEWAALHVQLSSQEAEVQAFSHTIGSGNAAAALELEIGPPAFLLPAKYKVCSMALRCVLLVAGFLGYGGSLAVLSAQDAPKTADAPAAEAKPAEAKPAETKPAEVKPEEKPAEPKPADATATPAGPLPGHSYHGEVFNEGPRQKAYLMSGMPKIVFPVTTKSPEAQQFIEQGIGQVHGFWYYEPSGRSGRRICSTRIVRWPCGGWRSRIWITLAAARSSWRSA